MHSFYYAVAWVAQTHFASPGGKDITLDTGLPVIPRQGLVMCTRSAEALVPVCLECGCCGFLGTLQRMLGIPLKSYKSERHPVSDGSLARMHKASPYTKPGEDGIQGIQTSCCRTISHTRASPRTAGLSAPLEPSELSC